MTSPAFGAAPGQYDPRKTWLLRALAVNSGAERRIDKALREALLDLEDDIIRIVDASNISNVARRAQMVGSKGVITIALHEFYGELKVIITEEQKNAAQSAIDASIDWDRKLLELLEPNAQKRSILRNSLKQGVERQLQAMITRVLKTEMPLSRRVYRTEALTKGQVSRVVNSGLARGISAAELAKNVRQFIDPSTPGGATYAAKRLARTEINNAFHAQTIAHNEEMPWVEGFNWHLSRSHKPRPGDKCEDYARQVLFPVGGVPAKPHPQCFCYVTPEVVDFATFNNRLRAGEFTEWVKARTDT